MSDELLAIVQAEERARAMIEQVEKRKEQSLVQAHAERKRKLSDLHLAKPREITIKHTPPDVKQLQKSVMKNRSAAVKKILEAVYAS